MLCGTLASAQLPLAGRTRSLQPPAGVPVGSLGNQQYSPPPGFNPYVANQQPVTPVTPTAPVIPGPALPPAGTYVPADTFVIEQPLPIYPATKPVKLVFSGEFLYFRASDAAMTSYAVPVNGLLPPIAPAVPLGPVAALELGFDPGFRLGLDWVWNEYSRWVASYTQLDLKDRSQIEVEPVPPFALDSLVLHPSTDAADQFFFDARADGNLRMRLGDVEYRRIFVEDWYRWDFLVGARYAHLRQEFASAFTNSTTVEIVQSRVNFDSGGIRFGMEGDWRSPRHGFFIYGHASTGFLAGRFSSEYSQFDTLLQSTVAFTSRKDDRIINVTDLELGVGWHSPGRRWWFSGGYLFSTWSDVVNNAGVIRAAQSNFYAPIRERLTFDGLSARAELRY